MLIAFGIFIWSRVVAFLLFHKPDVVIFVQKVVLQMCKEIAKG